MSRFTVPLRTNPRVKVPIPPAVEAALHAAATPRDIAKVIADNEPALAKLIGAYPGNPPEPYMYCDEAANLMSDVLKAKGIAHESVVGTSSEGSSHAWVRVKGRNYDPTNQGCSRKFEVVELWPDREKERIRRQLRREER